MSALTPRMARGVAGVVVLVVLALVVRGWWVDFRSAKARVTPSAETSQTATETSSPSPQEGEGQSTGASESTGVAPVDNVITVLIDGLNFRSQPKENARPLRGLDKGEKLDLLSERDSWFEARDSDGVTGWVSSNPSYTRTGRQ